MSTSVIGEPSTVVYIDGSARTVNGQPRSGYGIFWMDANFQDLVCQGELDDATCARAEVMAMKVVLQQIYKLIFKEDVKIHYIIRCDNIYVVRGVNEWMNKWHRENYKDRAHADLWSEIYDLYQNISQYVTVVHVYAHKGEYGNEMADKLAKGVILANQCQVSQTPILSSPSVPVQASQCYRPTPVVQITSTAQPKQTSQTVTPLPKQVSKTGSKSSIDDFYSWLGDNTVTYVDVQHGRQLKSNKYKGGITFYNTGTILPQSNWWQEKWAEYKASH